ncbi:MAG: lysophospholipid acyltransferase family protein [Pyrinomonadaceae bacterium]
MIYLFAAVKLAFFVSYSVVIYLVWLIANPLIPNKIFWRQYIFQTWARRFVKLANIKIEVIGDLPSVPFFLVSNHLGYIDIPVLRSVLSAVFVAKRDIESWFVAGKMVGNMGNIYVDRNNRRDIPLATTKIEKAISRGEGVIVFPEGTSTKGETVYPFNSSFFEFPALTNIPVHYAAITYSTTPPDIPASEAVCWWDDISMLKHLWRFFTVSGAKALIQINCETEKTDNRKELAKKVHQDVLHIFIPVI